MGDSENNLQPSKKRAAGVQLSRDNPGLDDNEDTSGQETGTFQRASEDVLATRRIVKVRRPQASVAPPAPSAASNPFAAIRLVPSASSAPVEAHSVQSKETEQIDETKSENKVDELPKSESTAEEKTEQIDETKSENKVDELSKSESTAEEKTDANDDVKQSDDTKSQNELPKSESTAEEKTDANDDNVKQSDDTKSQKNDENVDDCNQDTDKSMVKEVAEAHTSETQAVVGDEKEKENGEATDEKSAETARFSSFHQLSSNQNAFSGLSGTGFSSTSFSFGSISKDGSSLGSTFSFGNSNNGNSSIFGSSSASGASKSEASKFTPMQEVPLETGEENEKAVFTADSVLFEFTDGGWKERGKGELKVNVSTTGTAKARLVMRARGNYRLILNASLFPDMKLTSMDKKGITFACVNSTGEGKDGLSTFALKFKDASIVEDFRAAVMEHKSGGAGPVSLKTPENSPKADE